jgi:tetratricopeptide (TPR) repeat protein
METADPNTLMRRAEQAFVGGRLDSARADLNAIRQLAGEQPAILHLLALVERKAGNDAAAAAAFQTALRLAPADPEINSNYANLLSATGDSDGALDHYARAIQSAPGLSDARFNRAMLLQRLSRFEEALAEIELLIAEHGADAKYLSARGALLRSLDRLGEAAQAFDAALALDPNRPVALHGRARVAMERGEDDAAALYARAAAARPGDPELLLGLAEAMELEGRSAEGIAGLAVAVEREPRWAEGQALLARMRWEAGEGRAFTRDLEAAASKHKDPRLWAALAATLAGADLDAEAADAAARGGALAGDEGLRLAEAGFASEAGELDRADTLFAGLSAGLPGRSLSEGRHALRAGRYDEAVALLESARGEQPWGVAAWALTGLAWRLTGHERSEWLNDQPGFVNADEIGLDESEIAAIADRLRSIHRTRAHPIGQSLRGGTQTRGRLFERSEPEIQLLASRLRNAVDRYWQGLPAPDESHPLLRHRQARPRIEGSWSVRLTGGGFHVAHFHSRGIVSSATYLAVPETQEPYEGWLEIGSWPAGYDLPLEPLYRIEPAPGRLALFPSYMFHGTRPFADGERLTAAFDVVAR